MPKPEALLGNNPRLIFFTSYNSQDNDHNDDVKKQRKFQTLRIDQIYNLCFQFLYAFLHRLKFDFELILYLHLSLSLSLLIAFVRFSPIVGVS